MVKLFAGRKGARTKSAEVARTIFYLLGFHFGWGIRTDETCSSLGNGSWSAADRRDVWQESCGAPHRHCEE